MGSTRILALLLTIGCCGITALAGCGDDDASTDGASGSVREQAEELIHSDLIKAGEPEDQVDCVIDTLPDYSDQKYEAIVKSYDRQGGAPPDVAADVGSATVDCVS